MALKIFIGWDPKEVAAWHVLAHSILTRASEPVELIPLHQGVLRQTGVYWRDPDTQASTEFSLTRFLVPYLSNYEGYSLFMDCDMLCQVDIAELFEIGYRDPSKACWVVKHHYTPKTAPKMNGLPQTVYPCKNWSSLILFNNALCRTLSPKTVQQMTPTQLHQFRWLETRAVEPLPPTWNWLVEEYPPLPTARILHYTLGGPWFGEYTEGAEADRWREEYAKIAMRVG